MLISSIFDMMAWSQKNRSAGKRLGFVPTMGALHEGHESLLRRAKQENDLVAVSIFVNPLQFGPREDFRSYPRDLDGDRRKIAAAGGDIVFTTTPEQMYPQGFSTFVVPEDLASRFEGASRPGHFRGVATVVLKLFQIVRPHRAYFGRKDAQQLAVIQRMARDFHLDLEIVPCPTVRDRDGLALSSRNAYLSAEERERAPALRSALKAADRLFRSGERRAEKLLEEGQAAIRKTAGVDLDYLALVDPENWNECKGEIRGGLLLVAARVGKTRLIDNLMLGESE